MFETRELFLFFQSCRDVELRVMETDCTPSHISSWKAKESAAEFCLSVLRTDPQSIVTNLFVKFSI